MNKSKVKGKISGMLLLGCACGLMLVRPGTAQPPSRDNSGDAGGPPGSGSTPPPPPPACQDGQVNAPLLGQLLHQLDLTTTQLQQIQAILKSQTSAEVSAEALTGIEALLTANQNSELTQLEQQACVPPPDSGGSGSGGSGSGDSGSGAPDPGAPPPKSGGTCPGTGGTSTGSGSGGTSTGTGSSSSGSGAGSKSPATGSSGGNVGSSRPSRGGRIL